MQIKGFYVCSNSIFSLEQTVHKLVTKGSTFSFKRRFLYQKELPFVTNVFHSYNPLLSKLSVISLQDYFPLGLPGFVICLQNYTYFCCKLIFRLRQNQNEIHFEYMRNLVQRELNFSVCKDRELIS